MYIFKEFQKVRYFGHARMLYELRSFHFQKITVIIKIIFFWKFAETFFILYLKEQSTKIKFEKNVA